MANRYKDPDELNKRYMPKDEGMYEDDNEEYIPEEELTEEEREMMKIVGSLDWKIIFEWAMENDKEYFTLSRDERIGENILGKLSSTNIKGDSDTIYKHKLWIANTMTPKDAVLVLERLKKKPEKKANIPPDILDIIYAKAKEYKG